LPNLNGNIQIAQRPQNPFYSRPAIICKQPAFCGTSHQNLKPEASQENLSALKNNNCVIYEDPAIIFASSNAPKNERENRQKTDPYEYDVTMSTSGEHEGRPSSERPADYNEDANSTVSEILSLLSSCEGQNVSVLKETSPLSLIMKPHSNNYYQRS